MDGEGKKLSDYVAEEYRNGRVVFLTYEGLCVCDIDVLIDQPADGILYDINRLPETALTFMDSDKTWVNNFAAAQIIRKLKEKLDAKE